MPMTNALIINADALSIPLADQSVQCIVTSPPYFGLRDYGVKGQLGLERSIEEYVENMLTVFRECRRILKDDGTLWLNIGDSYNAHSCGRGVVGGIEGKRKNKQDNTANRNRANLATVKDKDLIGMPWRIAFTLQSDGAASPETMLVIDRMRTAILASYDSWDAVPDRVVAEIESLDREYADARKGGWYLRSDIIWHKPNPMPESIRDRPTKSHEYLFLLTKSARYYYDAESIAEPAVHAGEIRRNNKNGKNGQMGKYGQTRQGLAKDGGLEIKSTRNRRSVWTVPTQATPFAHFATMPEKLVEPCILAGSRPGDIVFDPFGGSGTTSRVATRLGRRGVSVELNFDYIQIAKKRISEVQIQLGL